MKYFIITGTSRGLGEALAYALLETGNQLFCISRTRNESLINAANERHVPLEYLEDKGRGLYSCATIHRFKRNR